MLRQLDDDTESAPLSPLPLVLLAAQEIIEQKVK